MTTYPALDQALAGGAGRRLASIPVTTLASGYDAGIFVHVIAGRRDGPRVAIVAGTHGGETFVTELIRVFASQIKAEEIAGTLMLVPMVNLSAFETGTRHTAIDMMNLNRIFPGDPKGWYTDKLAHALVTGLLPHCDWVVDYHCPSRSERATRYTYTKDPSTPYGRRVHEVAMASGAPLLYDAPRVVGSLGDYCEQLGIPTLIPEIGGSPIVFQEHMEAGLRELRNALYQLGVLEGTPSLPNEQIIVHKATTVRPQHGGLLCPEVGFDQMGVPIRGPRVLARVYHPATFEQLEEVQTPFANNVIFALLDLCRAQPGDYGYTVGDLDTATVVRNRDR